MHSLTRAFAARHVGFRQKNMPLAPPDGQLCKHIFKEYLYARAEGNFVS